jgi:hypothetical protein
MELAGEDPTSQRLERLSSELEAVRADLARIERKLD